MWQTCTRVPVTAVRVTENTWLVMVQLLREYKDVFSSGNYD